MARSWEEKELLLRRFGEWLAETEEELASLPDSDLSAAELADSELGDDGDLPAESFVSLVEAFSALRHELKLQTKSARGLDENVRSALAGLEAATRQFQSVPACEAQAGDRAALPLVEVLIGLDESLERCGRALESVHERTLAEGPPRLLAALEARFAEQSAWRRWWSRRWHETTLDVCRGEAIRAFDAMFRGLRDGVELVRQRLTRSLAEQQIRRIPCQGRRVDPNLMTVVELVDAPESAPETVLAELRPGYLWRARVLRFAEVRACRPAINVGSENEAESKPILETP